MDLIGPQLLTIKHLAILAAIVLVVFVRLSRGSDRHQRPDEMIDQCPADD
jgi:hypothetical protein